jgi:hypothetical protein
MVFILGEYVTPDVNFCNTTFVKLRDITLVDVELEEITNALKSLKSEVAGGASVGYIAAQADKGRRRLGAIYRARNVTGCLLACQTCPDEKAVQRSGPSQHQNQ